jgi:serine/threonine protein phosphatase PrpC
MTLVPANTLRSDMPQNAPGGAQGAAKALIDQAYERDSMDNLTALVVDLRSQRE